MDASLDRHAADRLLDDPTGAPAAGVDPRLTGLLVSAADLAEAEPSPALLAAMASEARTVAAHHMLTRRTPHMSLRSLAAKAAAVATIVTVTATGAAAATGTLPDQAQDALARAADRVGFDLPRSADDEDDEEVEAVDAPVVDDEADDVDATDDVEQREAETPETADPAENDHGQTVSSIARTDHESGRAHGEAVSEAARAKAHADRADAGATAAEPAPQSQPPVATPDHGAAATGAGNPAAEQAPAATPNHGAAADAHAPERPNRP